MSIDQHQPPGRQQPNPSVNPPGRDQQSLNDLEAYPELQPVIALAVDAVASAFALSEAEDPLLLRSLEHSVGLATVAMYAPMAATAKVLAEAEHQTREAQQQAVARTADVLAVAVAEVAATIQAKFAAAIDAAQDDNAREHEQAALTVARAAVSAAVRVATSAGDAAETLRLTEAFSASTTRATALEACYQAGLGAGLDAAEGLHRGKVG